MPPLRLILQQNTQSPNTYAANTLDSTKMSFMASLKESQLVRWGTVKRMTSLKRSETEQLWSSLEKNLFDDYFKVANKLLPNNTEETPRAVPIKLVLPDSIVIQDILPYHYSLLEYLQHALPLLFPKNQSKYQNLGYPVLHGTIIPLESIIGWLDVFVDWIILYFLLSYLPTLMNLEAQDPWAADPRASLSEINKISPSNYLENDQNPFEYEQSQRPTPLATQPMHPRSLSNDISAAQSDRHQDDTLIATLLVDFHHNFGPIIEYCHPKDTITDNDFTRLLPFLALPDGAHMTQEDFSYFHLKPPADGSLGNNTIFGISCNRQLKSSELLERDSHVTRSIVQKAIVVLTTKPVFGPIRDKLGVITRAFFSQRNFSELQLLVQFHQSLQHSLSGYTNQAVLNSGTNLHELVLKFKNKTLTLLKLLLLQKRILFFGYRPLSKHPEYPVERLCNFQYSLISLIPNLLHALSQAASPDIPTTFGSKNIPPTSLRTTDRESLLQYAGMPLDLFGKGAFFQPYMPLQQIDMLTSKDTSSFLVGTTNAVFTQQKNLKLDVVVNIETGALDIQTPGLEKIVQPTYQDRKWMDEIVTSVTNTHHRQSNFNGGGPVSFVDSDDWLRAKFEDYICSALASIKYVDYVKYGGAAVKRNEGPLAGNNYEKNPTQSFGEGFVNTMRQSTAFIDWNMRTDVALFDLIEPRHPYNSGNSLGMRLSEGLNDLHARLPERRGSSDSSNTSKNASSMKSTLGGFGAYIAGKARNSLPASKSSSSIAPPPKDDEAESAWQTSFANTSTQFDGNTQASRIYTDEYRQEAQEKLTKRLAPECISQRPGGGNSKVCYIEGHQAIALTNSIFGYDGWSSQIMDTKIVYIEQSPNHKWHCTAQALARVTVLSTGAFHEDVGFGDMANSPTRGAAIDKCMKEAVTDAVKRCLRYFGNSTGNCLYDNNYTREIVRHKDKNRYQYVPEETYRPKEFDYRPEHVKEQERQRLLQKRQQQQQQQQQYQVANTSVNHIPNDANNTMSNKNVKDEDLIWDGFDINEKDNSMLSTMDEASTEKSTLMPPPPLPANHLQPQNHQASSSGTYTSPKKNKGAESRAAALKRGRENKSLRGKLDKIEKSKEEDMALYLEEFGEWKWPKGDLYAYVALLNRLDGVLAKITAEFNLRGTPANGSFYGVQEKPFDAYTKRLLNAILRFLKLLIDNCSNRKIFNSVEHLDALIVTTDIEVLSCNLKLILAIQAHHRNALQLDCKALLALAWNWPTTAIKESQAQHSLLIYEPTLVPQLTQLLQLPLKDDYLAIQSNAIICLESLSHYKSKVSEVLSCLNAGVNQGLLFTYIRNVTNKLSQSKPSIQLVDLVDSIFSMISHLSTSNSGGQMLVGAGLITLLINLFKVDSSPLICKCLQLLDALLYSYRNALPIFINAHGLTTLVEKIHQRVSKSLENKTEIENNCQNDEDIRITFGKLSIIDSQAMKSSLRSIYRLLTSSGTEGGIRNLIDTTLLQDIHSIIDNRKFFGAAITSFALNIMATFVHNEPTSLSIIQEAKLPGKFYEAIEDHIEPNIDILNVIFNVISACCLNEHGLEEFKQRADKIISKIFDIFSSPSHIKVLGEKENAVNIGQSVDELIRHQPSLKPKVLKAINDQLDKIVNIGGSFNSQEVSHYGLSEVAKYRLLTKDEHSMVDNLPASEKREEPFALKCMDVMARFLESVFTNGSHAKEFLESGGLDKIGYFFSLPCLPYDFSITRASESIAQLGRVLIETKPEVSLTWSLDQMRTNMDATRHIWSELRNQSLFKQMKEVSETNYDEANKTYRSLVELYSRVQLVSDMFASIGFLNIRVSNGFFLPKLNEERHLVTMSMIGDLWRSMSWEYFLFNAEENKETDFDWKELETGSKSSNEKYEKNLNILMSNLDPTVSAKNNKNKTEEEKKEEDSDPVKLNYKSLLHLAMYIPETVTPFFQAVIKMFLYRRQSDQTHKKNSVITSKAVAQILVDHISYNGNGDPRPTCAYISSSLKLINLLIFDERTSHNHLQTPLVFSFAQQGGIKLLADRCDEINEELSKQAITDNEIPKSPGEMQQFRMYRILENLMPLLHTFAATRPLLESSQTGPLQLRETDKSSPEYFNANDFLVRVRSIILPGIIKVCKSEWLSKAPIAQPTRLIVQTFLNIIKAEGEVAEPITTQNPLQRQIGGPGSDRFGHLHDLERALTSMRSSPFSRILGEGATPEQGSQQPQSPQEPSSEGQQPPSRGIVDDITRQLSSAPTPDQALVEELISMDFPQLAARVALIDNKDVAQAAEWLVSRPDVVDACREEEKREERKQAEDKEVEMKVDEGNVFPMTDKIDVVKKSLDNSRKGIQDSLPSILLKLVDAHSEIVFDVKDIFKGDKEKPEEHLGIKTLLEEIERLDPNDRTLDSKIFKDNIANQRSRILNMTGKYKDAIINNEYPPKWLGPYMLATAIVLASSETTKPAPEDPTKVEDVQVNIDDIVDDSALQKETRDLFEIAITTFTRTKDKQFESRTFMAVLHVLALLTRKTNYSKELFASGGLQMLTNIFNESIENAHSSCIFSTILIRNMIEDEALIKTTMHNELLGFFATSSTRGTGGGSKVVDVSTFTKTAASLALRNPKVFMEVVKENCVLVSDKPAGGIFHIKLRSDVIPDLKPNNASGQKDDTEKMNEDVMQLDGQQSSRVISSETLDSVLHFLVSELMRIGKAARTFASKSTEKIGEEKNKEYEKKNEEEKKKSESNQDGQISQPEASVSATPDDGKKDEKDQKDQKDEKDKMPPGALEYYYACFLLQSITEICASYPSAKLNLVMTNKKRQGGGTPFKPKVTFLNFLISELISTPTLSMPTNDEVGRKQRTLAEWAIAVLVSTCTDTSPWSDTKDIANEVVLSRKFVLDVVSKLIKDNTSGVTEEDLNVRYARLTALAEILSRLIDVKPINPVTGKASNVGSLHMAKVMLEKNYVTTLTHALGDIDISFPNSKITIGALLIPLERLTKISIKMAKNKKGDDDDGNNDEDEGLNASEMGSSESEEDGSSDEDEVIEENDPDRAGTPDLYRNSALGMYTGENYEEENDNEDEDMDDEDMEDMEVDFGEDGSGSSDSSNDEEDFDSDDDEGDEMDADGEEADDWIDEEDDGEEVDFDEDAYDEEEALNPIVDSEAVIDAPTPDDEDPESIADPDILDDGLIDDGFSETDDEADEDGIAFRDEINVERAPRIGGIIDGRHDMGEASAIFGSPLLGGGSSRRRMFGGGQSQSILGGGRDRNESDSELPQQPLLVDQAPPSAAPTAQDTSGRRQGAGGQRPGNNNPLLQTIENMFGRNGFQLIEQLLQREAGGLAGVPPGTRVHLELHSPNGPSGPIPIEQLSNLAARRQQVPMSQSAWIMKAVNDLSALPTFSRWYHTSKLFYGATSQERATKLTNHIILMLLPITREALAKQRAEKGEKSKELENPSESEEEKEKKESKNKEVGELHEPEAREEEMREAVPHEAPPIYQQGDVEMSEVATVEPSASAPESNQTSTNAPAQEEAPSGTDAPQEAPADASASGEASGTAQGSGEASTSAPRERVTIKIYGRDVDITDTGIDPSFMEALPDDMRDEVITQHMRETTRASNAAAAQNRRTQGGDTGAPPEEAGSEISMEFLNALPAEIRAEVLQQEAFESLYRNRRQTGDANERGGSQPGNPPDPGSFLTSMDSGLRQFVLMNGDLYNPQEEMEPSMGRMDLASVLGGRRPSGPRPQPKKAATKHRQRDALQLLDKNGLAILIRLLFYPNLIKKSILFKILTNLIENSRTRNDLLLLLLNILQEGTGDLPAVDRSLSQLTLKGGKQSMATPLSTPTGKLTTKRKHVQETPASPILMQIPPETIPNLLAQRCFETLTTLVSSNSNASSFFLTEHDLSSSVRPRPSKKSKGKEKQTTPVKFPIVLLMGLLDRPTVFKTQMMMDTFTTLLATVTKPLSTLKKEQKDEKPETSEGDGKQQEQQPPQIPAADVDATPRPKQKENEEKKNENENEEDDGLKVAPQIPTHVLKYVVNILTVGECSSKTFQQTLSLIQNLSFIPDAKDIIAAELRVKAQEFGQQLNGELVELGDALRKAEKSDDVDASVMEKFLPASSLQARLLRVLKTVDYMFGQSTENISESTEQSSEDRPSSLRQVLGSLMREGRNQEPEAPAEPPAPSKEEAQTNELKVNAIYDSFNFGSVWKKLSENLKLIEENEQMTHIATVLLPLIESLMVVCKYVNPQTAALRTKRMTGSPISPSMHESIEDVFIDFTEEHRKIINVMVRNNPALMSGSFSLLVQNPRILEFDNKRSFFMQRLKAKKRGETYPTLHVNVRRSQVFSDSFQYLQRKTGDEIKYGKLSVKFYGEEGVDAGGVAREWFQVLTQQMFNPDYALFQPCDADRLTYQPNRASYVNEHHLSFFKFVGRIIGKAIYDGRLLDAYFTRSFYKHMLGRQVDFKDLESVDLSYYNSLVWMLENSIEGVLEPTFSVDNEEFGVVNVIDLIPNGRNIMVTDANKKEYVKLNTEFRLTKAIEKQIQCFLEGFHEIIPKDLAKIFSESELELLISGLPDIDVDEWKNQTDYHGFTPSDPIVNWFWRVLRSFDSTQKASFLQFVTGSSRVPLEGFGSLQGSQGTQRFNIHKAYGEEDKLPTAHTCFNQLDLGPYSSYEALRKQILTAIHEGNTGFVNDQKLDDSPVAINAGYLPSRQTLDRKTGELVDSGSYILIEGIDTPPPNCIPVKGIVKNYNTLEEFKKCDKVRLFEQSLDLIKKATTVDDLNRILLITFSDIKKFRFHYLAATPAIIDKDKEAQWYGKLTECDSNLASEIQSVQPDDSWCWITKKQEGKQYGARVDDWKDFYNNDDEFTLAFVDSSNSDTPGWIFRNLLYYVVTKFKANNLNVLASRSTGGLYGTLSTKSTYTQTTGVGWDKNAATGKITPKLVDLSASMNPNKLANQAVDLNLKLMKWRILPELNLEKVSNTKCLLLGAGTLGCYVARGLLAWGVNTITFVDNGRVSYSNPVRQPLFEFEDCFSDSHSGAPKASSAAEHLKKIYPDVQSSGHSISIPMPGHPQQRSNVEKDINTLEELVKQHDCVFLLTDSRESRWLPTLLGKVHNKIVINAALGFDSYLVMRHDSLSDRTLDQMCTVTRPGLAPMAASTAVEMLASILQHPDQHNAPSSRGEEQGSILGVIPHQIRGMLARFNNIQITGQAYDCCTACSDVIINRYHEEGIDMLMNVFNDDDYLTKLSGLHDLYKASEDALKDISIESEDDF
ncbi:hypothetical protein E3Q03_02533 [Wallemia mellicola]|uniref:HECT-type E3 ubiquitin transferase n=1 Tax=Wallemia mellicola TaxID=1708541 RepID=A0AB74KDI7_9BASI|nr:hypothetical protein E3Q03_02533 [Wallemia mellicola]